VRGKHPGVDQEKFAPKSAPDTIRRLHGVSGNNVTRLVGGQDFLNLRITIFVAPGIVPAKPQWSLITHAKPVIEVKKVRQFVAIFVVGLRVCSAQILQFSLHSHSDLPDREERQDDLSCS
jgi:hypothetical protein